MTTFRAAEWAEVADPVLLGGWRKRMRSAAENNARRRLIALHRDEFDAIRAEEMAGVDSTQAAILARRQANREAS
ncbi:MAG: hypothetical protein NVS1B16_05600 [Pseudarthrobacter sp.]